MAHFEDLFPGRFVKSVTLEHPITIRILSIAGDPTLSEEDGKPKVVLRYRTKSAAGEVTEMDAVWNKTNSILTAAALDTNDYTQWPGHTITIARDPTVKIGKEVVGGLRVVGSPELKAKKIVEIKRRKGRERYTLNPTDAQGRVRTAPPPAAAPGPVPSTKANEIAAAFGATPTTGPATFCPECGSVFDGADVAETHTCTKAGT
jgi:hypothetical protein